MTDIHIARMEEDKIADTGNKMASLLYSQKYVEFHCWNFGLKCYFTVSDADILERTSLAR